jgi:rubredoxin
MAMVIVLNSNGFKLPRLEKEKFVNLLRLGLEYNREQSLYSIKSYNNVEKLLDTISDILGDEVVFLQNCTRCGKAFPCKGCNYIELCTTKNLPFSCVCPQCLRDRKQFEEYLTKL